MLRPPARPEAERLLTGARPMKRAMLAALLLLPVLLTALAAGAARTSSQPDDPVAIARQHLRQNAQRFGLRPELDDLRLVQVKKSLGASHVRFQQTFGGVPVFAAFTTVNISDADSRVSLVLNRHNADLRPAVTQALVTREQAIALAEEAVGLQGEPRGLVSAEQVYFPVEKTYFLAWQVQVPAREPLGDWLVLVRADDGEVLLKQDVARTDSGRVFDPNPVKTGAPPPPPPPSDCDSAGNEASLSSEYRTQTLLGIEGGQDKLKGPYVDLCAPGILGGYKPECQADEASRNYTYACNDDRFEEVMTYYHVDAAQRKIQSLGFTADSSIINRPIPAHAHYFDDCNAFFSPWDRGLHFGDGNNAACLPYVADAAEDADVIVHEYGHAIQDDQVPGWGFGDPLLAEQAWAMGEGFGDFLASAIFGDSCEGEWFSFGLTSCGGQPGLRWLQNTKVYPADFEACPDYPDGSEEEHCTGEIWGGVLWDLVEALGDNQAARDLVLTLVLDSHFYLDPISTFAEGLSAIRQADQDLYGGSHISTINSVFAGRGITYVGSDPPPDFPFAYFRIRHTWIGDLVVHLKVGSLAFPSCDLLLWNRSGVSADDLAGYVDLTGSACAPYLPPSVGTPWWLEAQDKGPGDTGYIGDFQVALSGSQRCVATDVPVSIPDFPGAAVRSMVDCTTIVQPDQDADTVPDGSDNCPAVPNSDQANHDADPDGDACDVDDDGDGFPDTKETLHGSNPLDPQCVNATNDDSGDDTKINDGCAKKAGPSETDAQCDDAADSDGDTWVNDGCPLAGTRGEASLIEVCDGLDNDGDTQVDDGYPDSNPGGPKDCTDSLVDTDGDTLVNTDDTNDDDDGNWEDPDFNDGWFSDALEAWNGTDALDGCPENSNDDAWPPDFNNDRRVQGLDILFLRLSLASTYGGTWWERDRTYNRRYDLNMDGVINGLDVLFIRPYLGQLCSN